MYWVVRHYRLIKRVKKDIPSLYLWDEVGGATLTCGPHTIHQSEWDTKMVCDLWYLFLVQEYARVLAKNDYSWDDT